MPRLKKGKKGSKKERYGKNKHYHQRHRNKKLTKIKKSWKLNYPDLFVFDPTVYPFLFPTKKRQQEQK